VCPFFAYIIIPLSHKSPLLAVEPVLHQKGFIATVAAFRESPRAEAISNAEVVKEFIS